MSFIVSGSTGVTLFFVLSGFLLSLPIVQHRDASPLSFLQGRALRILPLYFALLIIAWLVTGDTSSIVKAMFFQFIGFGAFPFGVVLWTLTTEVQFYIAMTFVVYIWGMKYAKIFVATTIIIASIVYIYLFVLGYIESFDKSYWLSKSLLVRWPSFFIGALCAVIWHKKFWPKSRWKNMSIVSASFILLAGVLQRSALIPDASEEVIWHIHHVYESILWAVILLATLMSSYSGKWIIDNPVLRFLGRISYSVYLTHLPIMFYIIIYMKSYYGETIYKDSYSVLALLISSVAIVAISSLTYAWIEMPFLKMKR